MESYDTEEEQVEALKRWWNENGRSIVVAVVVALAGTFGWQSWQSSKATQQQNASDLYQAMMRSMGAGLPSANEEESTGLANTLKSEYDGTTYAQFAALHLAAIAVGKGELAEAEQELRWVLGKATKGSDTAQVAQVRLARVLAASGQTDQALAILSEGGEGAYAASYAVAQGDILLAAGRDDEAREAYGKALALAGGGGSMGNLPALQQKMQSLVPVPPRELQPSSDAVREEAGPVNDPVSDAPGE